ncbi:hypothetical protein K461DRAFT_329266 [Myriangium duriaei CBS 260.36]|uniref:BZIP domain-containing protein n=1 Tax=Myriangium duriaei CBS 260.36 TaxID=1168546 RepID=A0A9P4IUL0_9PEZI|nr:hypothetical protein K461DRAFT_329266 [Myriangium duriaei CBS 260.36]
MAAGAGSDTLIADAMTGSKTEDEHTPSSSESTPEPSHAAENPSAAPDPAQPQKRKGGRKPIYATSEERKQRNRQAQAAFRERRTEYIKQLEATIKQHEEALRSLQQSHRSAADECLMLRYKNSLLERILLEKGIDVQAELSNKTGSPLFDSNSIPPQMPAPMIPAPLQRTAVNRQHARRSYQTVNGRAAPSTQYMPRPASFAGQSPIAQPTPPSHASSPTALSSRSAASVQQTGLPSPASAVTPQQTTAPAHASSSQYQQPSSAMSTSSSRSGSTVVPPNARGNPSTYGYSPQFQKQIEQLEHEYDTPSSRTNPDTDADMTAMDQDYDATGFSIPHHYASFDNQQLPAQQQQQLVGQQAVPRARPKDAQQQGLFAGGHPPFDSFDTMLDSDPFGLSASMHFPTNYSFDQQPPYK